MRTKADTQGLRRAPCSLAKMFTPVSVQKARFHDGNEYFNGIRFTELFSSALFDTPGQSNFNYHINLDAWPHRHLRSETPVASRDFYP